MKKEELVGQCVAERIASMDGDTLLHYVISDLTQKYSKYSKKDIVEELRSILNTNRASDENLPDICRD